MIVGLFVTLVAADGLTQTDPSEDSALQWEDRVFFSVNGGYQTAPSSFGYLDDVSMLFEQAVAQVSFTGEGGGAFDVGGGVRLVGNFGVGAAYSYYGGDQTGNLIASVPSPVFFESPSTGELNVAGRRSEKVVHLHALYMVPVMRNLQIAVFGGPSWFDCQQDAISTFMIHGSTDWRRRWYLDPASQGWSIALANPELETQQGSTWGYNVGADINYLFSRHVGIGWLVRYSGASMNVENALSAERLGGFSAENVSVELGGLQMFVGLRLRF